MTRAVVKSKRRLRLLCRWVGRSESKTKLWRIEDGRLLQRLLLVLLVLLVLLHLGLLSSTTHGWRIGSGRRVGVYLRWWCLVVGARTAILGFREDGPLCLLPRIGVIALQACLCKDGVKL